MIECPVCGAQNPDEALHCVKCRAPLHDLNSQETLGDATAPDDWSVATAFKPSPPAASEELAPGSLLDGRYEILQLLGRGGMGAVYKARDKELDRLVAVKLIRPELARKPEMLRRFKQELILARQVTHKNVIRIFAHSKRRTPSM